MQNFFKTSELDFIDGDFLQTSFWSVKKSIIKDYSSYSKGYTYTFSENQDPSICTNRDLIYMEMAKTWSKNSYCKRMQVGCLIVKDKSIISDGYNGTPTGFSNNCETEDNTTSPLVLHAEANAITKLAKGSQSSEGSIIYVTLSPCFECSKLIIQSGIKKVVFLEIYRNTEPLKFLAEAGIQLVKLTLK